MAYSKTISTLRKQESTHWDIADALRLEIATNNDWDALADLLAEEGIEYKTSTLKAYRRVAVIFPDQKDRTAGASFAAHQAAATIGNTDQAKVALTRADKNQGKVTRDTVLAEVRQMKGRTDNTTSNAVAAWRDLKRGIASLLDLPARELNALLMMEGAAQGQAPDLSKDLAKVSVRIADSMRSAEKAIEAKKAKKAKAEKGTDARRLAELDKPKAQRKTTKTGAEKPKVEVGRMGKGRGVK